MNGIKMTDCRFYVNEDKRIIVCIIPNTAYMVEEFISDNFDFPELDVSIYGKLRKHVRMPRSFIGKAVCAPEDEWDEELGRKIAFAKAKDKCYKSFFKRANLFVQAVDRRLGDMITIFNDFGMKLENKREALQQQIDEKIKPESEDE